MTRVASLRALERALLACFKTPFYEPHEQAAPANPILSAYTREVVPLMDPHVARGFAAAMQYARERYDDDAAAMGYALAWLYHELRDAGETP